MNTLGERIENARDTVYLSRAELAQRAGMTYEAIYLIETGKRIPRRRTVRAIAQALGIDVRTLVSDVTDHDTHTPDQ